MLGIDRHAARCTWTAAVILLLLMLVYQIRTTLFVFVLALLFAYLLSPLVNLLDRLLPASPTRTPALALLYILIVGATIAIGVRVGGVMVSQAKELHSRLPAMIESMRAPAAAAATDPFDRLRTQAVDKLGSVVAESSGDLVSSMASAGMQFVAVASELIYVVIIPVLAFLFLKDADTIRQHILDLVPDPARHTLLEEVMKDVHRLLAHYMRALCVLSVGGFAAYAVFFTIVRMPYGVLLAAIAGILEFIPMIGPLTAAAMVIVVALVSKISLVAVLIFIVLFRMFQDYLVSPHLMGQGVELHPLLVLFGVFAGSELAGVAGTFLSVPVLAMARIFYLRIRASRRAVTAT